jgi:DNA-binding FrmR family transcriptional regulator
MIAEDDYCIDVMAQLQAVQAALTKINELLLENHLEHCVTDALRSDDLQRRERVIDELQEVFTMSRKVRLKKK